mgnify:CR=1 FL=1
MEFQHEKDRIFTLGPDGKLLAEVTFPIAGHTAHINHTFVDRSLRGQGVAAQLLTAAAEQIRGAGLAAALTCPYAVKWFSEHPEQMDLLEA